MVELEPETLSCGDRLIMLRQIIDRLELEFAQIATDFKSSQEWDDDGFNTAADWMRFNCHMSSTAAWNALRVGEKEATLAESTQAMRQGNIGFAHLATLAHTAQAVGEAFDETKLLALALEHSPGKFYFKCLHYRHSVDAKGYDRDQEDLAESRGLYLSSTQDGCVLINGVLDPVGGAAVRNALEPLAMLSGEHDHRTRPQRLADALVERVGGRRAEVQVTTTLETLKAMAGAAGAEMDFSLPISSAVVRQMACDCNLTRVLLDQESMVIDVGRSRRVISPTLRKALSVRDGHCRWPGCERPASWCDGHHMVHWVDGGDTNLGNLVLLCRRHHRMVHEGGWQLMKVDGRITTVAPTTMFGLPRGPD